MLGDRFLNRVTIRLIGISVIMFTAGCSTMQRYAQAPLSLFALNLQAKEGEAGKRGYLESGTIILSRVMPEAQPGRRATTLATQKRFPGMAPLVGYVPPARGFFPGKNEVWLSIDRISKDIRLLRGDIILGGTKAQGDVSLQPGRYALKHKQSKPLWYAPDSYFKNRALAVPRVNSQLRYRRGALGELALYPTTTFPIHSGQVWSKEVGGLKIDERQLSMIYKELPLGAAIIVK